MNEGEYPPPHPIYVIQPTHRTMLQTLTSHRAGNALNYHPFLFQDIYTDSPTQLTLNRPAPIHGHLYFFITPRRRSSGGFRRTVPGVGRYVQSGNAIDIRENNIIVGIKKVFYFEVGNAGDGQNANNPNGVVDGDGVRRGNWRMVEYTLPPQQYDDENEDENFEAVCTLENIYNYRGTKIQHNVVWRNNLDDIL